MFALDLLHIPLARMVLVGIDMRVKCKSATRPDTGGVASRSSQGKDLLRSCALLWLWIDWGPRHSAGRHGGIIARWVRAVIPHRGGRRHANVGCRDNPERRHLEEYPTMKMRVVEMAESPVKPLMESSVSPPSATPKVSSVESPVNPARATPCKGAGGRS
jgi:hypothetical protein